jgi:hypothetical protein
MYTITHTNDSNLESRKTYKYQDALQAFEEFAKYVDWGFADEHATVNLEMPTGKMYTKIFYREGRRVVKK